MVKHPGGRRLKLKKTSVNPASGRRSVSHVPLTPGNRTFFQPQDSQASSSASAEPPLLPEQNPEAALPPKQTRYSKQKTHELESWNKVRDLLYQTSVELASPISYTCTICHMEEDSLIFRCRECGPVAMFCIECLRKHHKGYKSFHVPDKWEGNYFRPFHLSHTMELSHHADCRTRYRRSLRVFDPAGRLQNIDVTVCGCEQISCTLLRYGLWGSTVSDPQTAFSTSLLEWLVMLTLEAHVSVEAFCKVVRYKNNLSLTEMNTLYRALIGQSVAEFRHFMYRVRTTKDLCPLLDDGTTCPACPKMSGTHIIALDGNFGLVRKRSSGSSIAPPLHGTSVFMEDAEVKQFVDDYCKKHPVRQDDAQDCSNFKAGNPLRSKSKQDKLDVSGVFGSVCRHEIPGRFLNMTYGERLGYPVTLIKKLLADVEGRDIKLNVIYDIACTLDSHLKVTKQKDLRNQLGLALDVFHAYGHISSCQLKYSTRRLPGYGLTDGESVERMWSYLRHFASITKEMTDSRRTDLLTDGLLHYSMRKTLDIEISLVKRKENAEKAICVAIEGLQAVMKQADVSMADIQVWAEREKDVITGPVKHQTSTVAKWKTEYVKKLLLLKTYREKICSSQEMDAGVYRSSFLQLDKQLAELEQKHGVRSRWTASNQEFDAVFREVDRSERTGLLSKMRCLAYERTFITSLMRKHPDGQSISSKLSKQLKAVNIKLQKAVQRYNDVGWEPTVPGFPPIVDFREAATPTWEGYLVLDPSVLVDPRCPRSVQRGAIDHLDTLHRAKEELEMVRQEMKDVFLHFQAERDIADAAIVDLHDVGKIATLTCHVVKLEKRLVSMYHYFIKHVPDLDLPIQQTSYLLLFPFQEPDGLESCETLSDDEIVSEDEALSDVDSLMDEETR